MEHDLSVLIVGIAYGMGLLFAIERVIIPAASRFVRAERRRIHRQR